MKLIICICLLLSLNVYAADELIGTWKFTEYIYQGQTQPIPNPNLDLRFTFYKNGYSLLKWLRTDEEGICQRLGTYHLENQNALVQKTVWVDPENDVSCATDLEMHLGYETFTPFEFVNGHLHLKLALNGQDFIYVFTLVD